MSKVSWSPEAVADYEAIIDYLLETWTIREAQNFIDEVSGIIKLLQTGIVQFKLIGYKDIRGVSVSKYIYILYRIRKKNEIELVRFWDTRQDPEKLKKL